VIPLLFPVKVGWIEPGIRNEVKNFQAFCLFEPCVDHDLDGSSEDAAL
jgi:hypothetical protein